MLTLLTLLLATSNAQAPALSAPKYLSGDGTLGASAGQEAAPVLAHGAGVTLAVWSDRRALLGGYAGGPIFGSSTGQSDDDLLAQRFDAQGAPLDALPFVISAAADRQIEPQVAFNGQNFLVAWRDGSAVRALRVNPSGALLDPSPILVDAAADTFSLAANGATWLIVTENYQGGAGGLIGYRIGANGALLDAGGVTLVPETFYLYFGSRLAAANGEWLLVYSDSLAGILGQRLSSTLATIAAPFSAPSRSLASNGTQFIFAWQDFAQRLLVSRVQGDGTNLDPQGIVVSNSWWWNNGATTLSWGNGQWWLAFPDINTGISLARVTAGGVVLDPGGFSLAAAALKPEQAALAGLPGGVQASWLEDQSSSIGATQSFAQALSGPGSLGAKMALSTSAPAQARPDIAEHAEGIAMAYWSLEADTAHVKVALLDRFGNALTPEPVEVFSGPSANVSAPAIAWNGSLFLVVWSDRFTGIAGRRMLSDGSFVDPAPFAVLAGEEADVAAVGANFLVVGAYAGSFYSNRSIYGARVDGATGTVLDPGGIFVGGPFATSPVVDALGGRWIVAWQNHWSHNSTIADLAVNFVSAAGVPAGGFGIENQGYAPDIACSSTEALITYRLGSIATPAADVKGQRVRADGALLGAPFIISGGVWKEFEPAVCWTGAEWVVAWEDLRHAAGIQDGRTEVYAARVSAAGGLLDPSGFALAPQPGLSSQPALAGSSGVAVAAYAWMRREAPFATWRVATRVVGPWADLGFALAGASGVPMLDAAGALTLGSTVEMALSHARPLANGMLFASSVRVDQPFHGGTLVPRRDRALPFSTDGDGRALLLIPVTRALPHGLSMHVQAWILDPSGPQGATSSNALLSIAP
jgi:hypothetical protein